MWHCRNVLPLSSTILGLLAPSGDLLKNSFCWLLKSENLGRIEKWMRLFWSILIISHLNIWGSRSFISSFFKSLSELFTSKSPWKCNRIHKLKYKGRAEALYRLILSTRRTASVGQWDTRAICCLWGQCFFEIINNRARLFRTWNRCKEPVSLPENREKKSAFTLVKNAYTRIPRIVIVIVCLYTKETNSGFKGFKTVDSQQSNRHRACVPK